MSNFAFFALLFENLRYAAKKRSPMCLIAGAASKIDRFLRDDKWNRCCFLRFNFSDFHCAAATIYPMADWFRRLVRVAKDFRVFQIAFVEWQPKEFQNFSDFGLIPAGNLNQTTGEMSFCDGFRRGGQLFSCF